MSCRLRRPQARCGEPLFCSLRGDFPPRVAAVGFAGQDMSLAANEGRQANARIAPSGEGRARNRAACHMGLRQDPLRAHPNGHAHLNFRHLKQTRDQPMSDAKKPASPLASATILLLRDGAHGIEVFMVRRAREIGQRGRCDAHAEQTDR